MVFGDTKAPSTKPTSHYYEHFMKIDKCTFYGEMIVFKLTAPPLRKTLDGEKESYVVIYQRKYEFRF